MSDGTDRLQGPLTPALSGQAIVADERGEIVQGLDTAHEHRRLRGIVPAAAITWQVRAPAWANGETGFFLEAGATALTPRPTKVPPSP